MYGVSIKLLNAIERFYRSSKACVIVKGILIWVVWYRNEYMFYAAMATQCVFGDALKEMKVWEFWNKKEERVGKKFLSCKGR